MSMSTEVTINYAGRYSIEFTSGSRELGQNIGCVPNGPSLQYSGQAALSLLKRRSMINAMPNAVTDMSKLLVADAVLNSYQHAYMVQAQEGNTACQSDAEYRTLDFFLSINDEQFSNEFEEQLYHALTVYVRLLS